MKYQDFEEIMSSTRMTRYLTACGGDTRKAMTLYRLNLNLSQELFTVISCFEVSLRNAINKHYINQLGHNWLKDSIEEDAGIFSNNSCRVTADIISKAYYKLNNKGRYTHSKILAEMDFGFWRYLFAKPQFNAASQTLLHIFPAKPKSTPSIQYNQRFVFNQLEQINELRNRIAHHEPICFQIGHPIKDTTYARQHYNLILQLFQWMSIDESALLYGLDHINTVCAKIEKL
jgi:hypothetical protein